MKARSILRNGIIAAAFATTSFAAYASHSWSNYHWARTGSSFTLRVIDSNTTDWDDELSRALSQWSQSTKLDMVVSSSDSSAATRSSCPAPAGKIRSCNYTYGQNGWLGLASINLDSRGHISTGTSKMNDSYSSSFASQNQRWHVMCQELGHLLGLNHTSTNGTSQSTCMDYSQSASSVAPNSHDYAQLVTIYGHTDSYASTTSLASTAVSPQQLTMAGGKPLGMRISFGVFDETWVAPDGRGGVWIHKVILAPGHEHTELLGD